MMTANEPELVNQAELSNLFGVTTNTIRAWERQGMPVVQRGRPGHQARYSPRDAIRWREDRARLAASGDLSAVDMAEARRRKLVAEAASAEIDLDVKRGAVVEYEIVIEEVGRSLDACRARLLSLGGTLAPLVAIEADGARCKQLIDNAVNEALEELSSGDALGDEVDGD